MLYNSIPVVMYHHISETDRELNVYPGLFDDHLRLLSRKGWKTLDGEEFLYFIENRNERPKKCVLLTFDDGFADNYVFAYPLLRKHGMKAMIFVATGFVDDRQIKRDGFVSLSHNDAWELAFTERRSEVICTWDELREMQREGVFDVQAHGASHKTPDFMMHGDYEALRSDLMTGKAVLEEKLGKEIRHLAWPRGHFDERGIQIAQETGFKALYTTERGPNTRENLHMINRLPVKCRSGKWLLGKLPIYSSRLASKLYLAVRTGI